MMRSIAFLLALCAFSVVRSLHVDLPAPFNDFCILDDNENKYTPNSNVPWFNVDLDADPKHRWDEIAGKYKTEIAELIGVVENLILPIFPEALQIVDIMFADLNKHIPDPYQSEIIGISDVTGIPLGRVVLYNVFYEIFTVCTSIVAQDTRGQLVHARNLDFGLFLGWNGTTHEWMVSTVLRKMIVNINWQRKGKTVFKSNNFAGFIGIYNGMKQGAFTVTANERFQLAGGFYGMLRYLLGLEPNGKWMTWLTRETMEQANSYQQAVNMLSNTPMLSPVYYIVGGVKPFEGVIITRSLNATDLTTKMDPTSSTGWYLLQTNYDQNLDPLFLDDRRTPGNKCMQKLGQTNVGFKGIYNVLSSRTSLNKLTTYTVLMSVATGQFETHIQTCPGDCWGW
ncbi:CRE-ASAH-1 protein [Aphelenchoides avenae]|nr:CRE-ASAH-1 protein [Aphelenchus avenae]